MSSSPDPAATLRALVEKWTTYRDQPTRYFNAPTAAEVELDERCRRRENTLITVFLTDLAALSAAPARDDDIHEICRNCGCHLFND